MIMGMIMGIDMIDYNPMIIGTFIVLTEMLFRNTPPQNGRPWWESGFGNQIAEREPW